MMHIYEIDSGRGHNVWEVYEQHPYKAWSDTHIETLNNPTDLNDYIDNLESDGYDYILFEADHVGS